MTALEISDDKVKVLRQISYLHGEIDGNNTGTVLLTNDEVMNIVEALEKSVKIMNSVLGSTNVSV
jgi:hypothetical protein